MNWVMMSRSSLVIGATLPGFACAPMWRRDAARSMPCEIEGAEVEPACLDHRAAVHHDRDAGLLRPLSRRLVHHAELHPDHARAEPDRLVHGGSRSRGGAENVHH